MNRLQRMHDKRPLLNFMGNKIQGEEPIPTGAERNAFERRANEMIDPNEFLTSNGLPPWKNVETITPLMMKLILTEVANGSSIQTAARRAGTSVLGVMVQRVAVPEFGYAMNEALKVRRGLLEEKAWELAVEGVEVETVKDHYITTRTEYPNAALLQFLLKADNPEKFGIERKEVRAGPLETPPETIRTDKDRERLRKRLKERLETRQKEVIDAEAIAIADVADLL